MSLTINSWDSQPRKLCCNFSHLIQRLAMKSSAPLSSGNRFRKPVSRVRSPLLWIWNLKLNGSHSRRHELSPGQKPLVSPAFIRGSALHRFVGFYYKTERKHLKYKISEIRTFLGKGQHPWNYPRPHPHKIIETPGKSEISCVITFFFFFFFFWLKLKVWSSGIISALGTAG